MTETTPSPNTGFTRIRVDAFEDVPEQPGARKPDPILVVESLTRRFGGLMAVDVDHLEFQRGAITGLIGPNGAGKTTLFNLLTGFDKPNTGTWSFNGRPMRGLSAHKVAQAGMVRTFQLTKALSRLTVMDNMKLGATGQTGERFFPSLVRSRWRGQEKAIEERAEALLERFNLHHMRDEFAGALSGGQRKLLEMARALMVEPELVMLDEPMAGVNPALAQTIIGHVRDLAADGLSVVFVEHDMDVVRTVSDWVVVMAEGRVIAEGRHASIVTNPEVIDAYLGRHHGTPLDPAEQERQLAEAQAEIEAELEAEERAREQEGA
ncbi:MAG: ABC transporter ATP-binding protein [Thermoanaerobacterales bacterium]|jgi:branched-chain amino acid transport system ATP-binding protein|nr:ABC transporter ATP-binding protein [Thermoanaerobacterales bacterium]